MTHTSDQDSISPDGRPPRAATSKHCGIFCSESESESRVAHTCASLDATWFYQSNLDEFTLCGSFVVEFLHPHQGLDVHQRASLRHWQGQFCMHLLASNEFIAQQRLLRTMAACVQQPLFTEALQQPGDCELGGLGRV